MRLNRPKGSALIPILVVLSLLGAVAAFLLIQNPRLGSNPKTYAECLESKGSTVQESYPAVCVTRAGIKFVQPLSDEEKRNLKPPTRELSSADICAKSNYSTVKICGKYVIATRSCCDQPSDILSTTGEELASCGGLVGPTPPQSCIKFQEIQKQIDLSNCQEFICKVALKSTPFPSNQPPTKTQCKSPRPQICTQECINPPPYLCGSNSKSYCSVCQACADPKVDWYSFQEKEPCLVSPVSQMGTGSLEVTISTGPTCPGGNTGGPCTEPYANKAINIYAADNLLASTRTTDKNGKFSLSLPAGEYYLKSATNKTIGALHQTPFTISPNQNTTLNLDVDTGTR